jgi:hypothetical protein
LLRPARRRTGCSIPGKGWNTILRGPQLVVEELVPAVFGAFREPDRAPKNILSLKDLENIERRASSAYTELEEAWHFEHVIPNHDGEDSENWDAFYYPVGDARKALLAFAGLIHGEVSPLVEEWDEQLLA